MQEVYVVTKHDGEGFCKVDKVFKTSKDAEDYSSNLNQKAIKINRAIKSIIDFIDQTENDLGQKVLERDMFCPRCMDEDDPVEPIFHYQGTRYKIHKTTVSE